MKNVPHLLIPGNIIKGIELVDGKKVIYLDGANVFCEACRKQVASDGTTSGIYAINVSCFQIFDGVDVGKTLWQLYQQYLTQAADTFIQPKITGYRQLSQEEVALMNEGKALAEQCGEFIEKLREKSMKLDQRWISIGATDLQKGFMAVTRGIAQPTTF